MAELHQLYEAIDQGDTSAVARCLSASAELLLGDGESPPPLHWAIYHNQTEVAQTLLDHGATTRLRDPDRGATALEYAVTYARQEIIALLIESGGAKTEALAVAEKGAAGGFKEFAELPTPDVYKEIVNLLRAT